eukprot:SM000106S13995  [mRNA]  locus=s106:378050:382571:- [translate_table: standard]
MADEAKARGNAAFSAGSFEDAARHFSDAIELAPDNHVLYSNRSAAYASMHKYGEALADAQRTVELRPDWGKGYSRLGAALVGLRRHQDAVDAYRKGLVYDPSNEALKSGFKDAEAAQAAADSARNRREDADGGGLGNIFKGPEVWTKLQMDPRTRPFMAQPDFVAKIKDLQDNQGNLQKYFTDQRIVQAMGVLIGVNLQTYGGNNGDWDMTGEEAEAAERSPSSRPAPPREAAASAKASAPEREPEAMEEVSEEEQEKRHCKEEAAREKEAGTAAYKARDFDTAVAHYTRAAELDDEDVTYLTNRAATYLEMGKYDECIADCDKAVERGRELHADYKTIARALTRKGTAYVKQAKTATDYDPAIQAFQKALTEHRNPDTLKKLNEAERVRKELEQQEYYDPTKADEEREKGNELFKEQQYPEAVKHYTEALRRNPNDVKAYSNRAACYTKLTALPEALKDANKCIELDPSFVKGYTRKGTVQFFMKEYDKALETFQEGLKHDENNQELLDGIRRCVEQVRRTNRGDLTPEELKERQAKSLQDPEIQAILTDPIMRQVLTDFQENPQSAMQHQKNPMIMAKIQKLVAAGIVQVR